MRDAYLLGAGQTAFGSFPDESYRSLAAEAIDEALATTDG
ncbi:MAG: 3-ketoacyl-CoA thiolase, partial [Halobacteriota archaeon]